MIDDPNIYAEIVGSNFDGELSSLLKLMKDLDSSISLYHETQFYPLSKSSYEREETAEDVERSLVEFHERCTGKVSQARKELARLIAEGKLSKPVSTAFGDFLFIREQVFARNQYVLVMDMPNTRLKNIEDWMADNLKSYWSVSPTKGMAFLRFHFKEKEEMVMTKIRWAGV